MPLVHTKKPPRIRGPFKSINSSIKTPGENGYLTAIGVYTPRARRRRTHEVT